jgi:amino acid adenylation domain-containing protein/thioester reductase-like protein
MPPPYNFDELCLQDLFIEQASKTPNAIAVVDGDIELTYHELDLMTDHLAVLLHSEYDVGPDSVVGILMPRSATYVIAYVAILKAGGAYMPLELVYPKQLLERAVDQTQAKLVLTTSAYQSRVSNKAHYCIDDINDLLRTLPKTQTIKYPKQGFTPRPNADHLAFVVMSSGTTGVPKGICQVHRSAVHSYMDRWNRYPYHADKDNVVQDRVGAGVFFVWELFRPLCRGATCVVIPDHVLFDPDSVTKFVQQQNITRILFTPSLLQLILDTLPPAKLEERFAQLRYLWLCGEVVTVDLATTFGNLLSPTARLLNLYSISECHDVSIGDLRGDNLDVSRKYATCGVRCPGVTFYIVDLESAGTDQLKLVKPTTTSGKTGEEAQQPETGEVFVGGPVIARGYLHMPEKTAERFVPNPFDDSCDKLYRTGDLGRLLPSIGGDQLEILGRCDFMVKIRGYSVVLGAVESALAKHPKLCSAVVLAVGPEGTDKKLVAYVVPTTWEDAPSAASVRAFLKEHVPPYAIPGTFCVIDALPVGASAAGKLDRKGLPDVAVAKRLRAFSHDIDDNMMNDNDNNNNNTNTRLAPQNDMELMILEIWTQLLSVPDEDLSMGDSFFEVGGHSLLATRLVFQVNQQLGLDSTQTGAGAGLSIQSVVQAPTIREMADRLLSNNNNDDATSTNKEAKMDLNLEADALDPSIYPFATRKGETMARFRMERTLLTPRVVFLTGATGYLGVHILAELLQVGTTVVCLARAKDDAAARQRILDNLKQYQLLDGVSKLLEDHLHAVAGDLSKPLLGMDISEFKTVALEVDSIIHCGAQVNLIKPYQALKESNVLGTQEILRLATTNGFVKTKVKPVHYISTNGIFPVDVQAYDNGKQNESALVHCIEDWDLQDPAICENLSEGYSMTKWVAERMCTIAESRGLPISVMRPGNMAGSTTTAAQNHDDLHYLFIKGMLELQCAPDLDRGSAYALDLTPVDFAAKAVVQLAVQTPYSAIGQRFHLQNAQEPVLLKQITEWLRQAGHTTLTSVTRDDFFHKLQAAAQEERDQGVTRSVLQQLESGFEAFETYFMASTWLRFGSDNLQQALGESSIACPPVSMELLKKWFPVE